MKKYQSFLSENFQFLEIRFSIYLNRRVFVMVGLVMNGSSMSYSLFYFNRETNCTFWIPDVRCMQKKIFSSH